MLHRSSRERNLFKRMKRGSNFGPERIMTGPRKSILKWGWLRHFAVVVAMYFISALTFTASAQSGGEQRDSVRLSSADSLGRPVSDSASIAAVDSSARARLEDSLGIRISPDALPAIVTTSATDSAV